MNILNVSKFWLLMILCACAVPWATEVYLYGGRWTAIELSMDGKIFDADIHENKVLGLKIYKWPMLLKDSAVIEGACGDEQSVKKKFERFDVKKIMLRKLSNGECSLSDTIPNGID